MFVIRPGIQVCTGIVKNWMPLRHQHQCNNGYEAENCCIDPNNRSPEAVIQGSWILQQENEDIAQKIIEFSRNKNWLRM